MKFLHWFLASYRPIAYRNKCIGLGIKGLKFESRVTAVRFSNATFRTDRNCFGFQKWNPQEMKPNYPRIRFVGFAENLFPGVISGEPKKTSVERDGFSSIKRRTNILTSQYIIFPLDFRPSENRVVCVSIVTKMEFNERKVKSNIQRMLNNSRLWVYFKLYLRHSRYNFLNFMNI